MPERDIAKACTRRWDALGLLYRRVCWQGRNGAPDFVVLGTHRLTAGREAEQVMPPTVWVETKAPGQRPTKQQEIEHERMRAAGQVVLVISCLEDLDRWFPL